jgi:hypothetical protein
MCSNVVNYNMLARIIAAVASSIIICLHHRLYIELLKCAAYYVYMQRTIYICSVLLVYAAYYLYMQRTTYMCSILLVYAAYYLYLQRTTY